MGRFGKILPFERFEFLESITSSLLVCQQLSSSRRGGAGQKSLLFFFNNYQFQMTLFFLLFILNLVTRLYYMEIKSNNSNYRKISTKLIIVGTLLKFST